jgi:hypothetical protein
MHLIGYWIQSLLDEKYFPPQELVGEWPAGTRERVATCLDQGSVFESYRGISWCRFGCGHHSMGSRELTDGHWVWPEGLSHYVRAHGVVLPGQFLSHVLGGGSHAPEGVRDQTPSDQLWRDWCRATSSRHIQPALADALARANARAQELREADWKLREANSGLSNTKCMQQGCPNMALAGKALCAMHASELDGFDPGRMAYFEGLLEVLNA